MSTLVDWLAGVTRDAIPGLASGAFDYEANPTWKLLVHTTEGFSYASARASYIGNRFAPNATVGPDPAKAETVRAWQHFALSSRSTTLADAAGGIRPNRDYVIQVEVVGFCDPKYAGHWLHVDNWPAWYKAGVARVLRQILDARPIPRRSTVRWVRYPASYGTKAAQRLSVAAFDAYSGILGHQHAPENSHGDPGDISAFVRDYLVATAPPEEDLLAAMTPAELRKIIGEEIDKRVGPAVWSHRLVPGPSGTRIGAYDPKTTYTAGGFQVGPDAYARELRRVYVPAILDALADVAKLAGAPMPETERDALAAAIAKRTDRLRVELDHVPADEPAE